MQKGYTLIELLTVMSIVIITATVALPSAVSTVKRDQLVTTANQLSSTFKFARSEAVKREEQIYLVESDGKWLVTLNDEVMLTFENKYENLIITGLENLIVRSSGETTSIRITIEDTDYEENKYCFEVLVSGQSKMSKGGCNEENV